MMDPDDKPDGPPKRTAQPINPKDITPEQVRVYKDCMYGLIFKAGLPYASIAHLLSLWRAKSEVQQQQPQQTTPPPPKFPVKRAFFFCANMLIGTFLFAPLCYHALVEKHNLDRKRRVELPGVAPVSESTQTPRLPDDYSYPIDFSSNLNEAETTFTSEFGPAKILPNEDEVPKVTPSTTYQDLRNKHRSSYGRRQEPPPPPEDPKSSFRNPDENPVDNESSFNKREPRKFVKRNKYGDEIE